MVPAVRGRELAVMVDAGRVHSRLFGALVSVVALVGVELTGGGVMTEPERK